MAVRSKKVKAVILVKWLTKKSAEKIQEEHQQAIKEKDATITHRDNQIQILESTNEKYQHKILRLNEDYGQTIEEKDTALAVLNDYLKKL